MPTIKSLGQHWLTDRSIIASIVDEAKLTSDDTVLEIGPGLGTMTSELLRRGSRVVAVEFDAELARKLPGQFPGTNLTVFNEDIIHFDLNSLPEGYAVVANVPYYITSKIIEKLMTASNKPSRVVLLVQKEVAERVSAQAGKMSILAVSVAVYSSPRLGIKVPKEYFAPPPKVDSQVIVLEVRPQALLAPEDEKAFWRVVKAGFREKRKKLRSSIAGGLAIDKQSTVSLLTHAGIDPDARAEDLSVEDWLRLARDAV